jgi:predicted O-methyltransferase YrrM
LTRESSNSPIRKIKSDGLWWLQQRKFQNGDLLSPQQTRFVPMLSPEAPYNTTHPIALEEASMKTKLLRWLLQSDSSKNLSQYIPIIAEWLARTGCINEAWVKPETYRLFQENGFHLVRNHYYGVLPDTRKLNETWWTSIPYLDAYNKIKKADADKIFMNVLQWADELQSLPRESPNGFYWNNGMFPPLDTIVLYGMIREYQPKKLLEIGSGFSTEIALLAAKHTKTAIHCVEPHPSDRMISREAELMKLTRLPIQELQSNVFAELQAGDFLFIDTTHTVKISSDVNHLIFNVLPYIAPGVFIHVHDIFLPYEYPKRWYDDISIFWNEQYLLLAYLLDNPIVEIVLPNYSLSTKYQVFLRERLKDFDIWGLTENIGGASGASMWLQKI